MATKTKFTLKASRNKKLGKAGIMFSTYRPVTKRLSKNGIPLDGTCPKSCPLLTKCYANFGNVNIHQNNANKQSDNLVERIKALPENAKVRHLVSGDFGKGNKIDGYLEEAIEAHTQRPDVIGYSYTHHWRNYPSELFNRIKNFKVNASCETDEEVRDARSKGWNVVQVMPMNSPDVVDKGDYKVTICPAQTKAKLTCEECMLCSKDRKSVVGFKVHSTKAIEIEKDILKLNGGGDS